MIYWGVHISKNGGDQEPKNVGFKWGKSPQSSINDEIFPFFNQLLGYLVANYPRIVSGLFHPSDWCGLTLLIHTYPIYNWGYNPLTKWDEPPSSPLTMESLTPNQQDMQDTLSALRPPSRLTDWQMGRSATSFRDFWCCGQLEITSLDGDDLAYLP